MKTIFVGGVHGVGKSTCCEQVAASHQWLHARASDLIRQQRADAIARVGKLVADVDGNQRLLLCGIEKLRASPKGASLLLDGHFALRDVGGVIQRLPMATFSALQLYGLVCFVDEPIAIASRMRERDRQDVSEDDVAALQAEELSHARQVARALAISLEVLPALDTAGLSRLVAEADH